jgi:hypothetical protein
MKEKEKEKEGGGDGEGRGERTLLTLRASWMVGAVFCPETKLRNATARALLGSSVPPEAPAPPPPPAPAPGPAPAPPPPPAPAPGPAPAPEVVEGPSSLEAWWLSAPGPVVSSPPPSVRVEGSPSVPLLDEVGELRGVKGKEGGAASVESVGESPVISDRRLPSVLTST